jgi:hypothetical protein
VADDTGVSDMSHSDQGPDVGSDAGSGHGADERFTDGEVARHRLAGGLALGLAVALVVVPVVQVLQFGDVVPAGEGMPGRWSFLPSTLAEAAPWFVGAVLLQAERIRLASAVLMTAAVIQVVFTLPLAWVVVFSLPTFLETAANAGPWTVIVDLLVRVAFAAIAATIALLVRRRPDELAPEPRRAVPRFVGVAAGLVALRAVFVGIVPLAPSSRTPADSWFPTTFGSGQFNDPFIAVWTVLPALLAIGVAVVAFRLGGDVAGAILLTFAGPQLISEVNTHVVNVTAFDGMITPIGGLILVGLVGLVAAGFALLGSAPVDEQAVPLTPRPPTPTGMGD